MSALPHDLDFVRSFGYAKDDKKHFEAVLEVEIARMNRVLDMLRFKCWYYEQAIRDGNEDRLSHLQPEEMPEDPPGL